MKSCLAIAFVLLLELTGCMSSALAQPAVGAFAVTGNMTTPRVMHTATLLADGRVLVAGGWNIESQGSGFPGKSLASAELYDPATGTFERTGSMATPRALHTATLLPDGKVLIAGGGPIIEGAFFSLASAERYDPATGTFEATGNMSVERGAHTATLLSSGKVLIAGGFRRAVGSAASTVDPPASAELYDPSTGDFAVTGAMTSEGADTATLLPDGRVLITRGAPETTPLFLAEVYDPSTSTFAGTGNTTTNHTGPTANLLPNGKVLVAGGDTGDGDGQSFVAELYDPASRVFSATGNMIRGREQNAATRLADGTILLTGGHIHPAIQASAELYDPVKGTFSATGNMTAGRELHASTLLRDGRVLVTGGAQEPWLAAVLSGAELYTPAITVPTPVLLSVPGDGQAQGAILHAGTARTASSDNPAVAGEALEIYWTGLLDGSLIPPQIAIGGRMAEVLWFGKTSGYVCLNQVNVRVPNGVAPGSAVSVRLTYLDRPSNGVTIAIQ
jgi:hypothetical protein